MPGHSTPTTEPQMNKSYHQNAEGDDLIHVVKRSTFGLVTLLIIAAGVAVAFLQGGAV